MDAKQETLALGHEVGEESHRPANPAPGRLNPTMVGLVLLTVLLLLWGVWVTKTLVDQGGEAASGIKSVQLQPLIQEYLYAQSRSGGDETMVARQTEAFMTALEEELQDYGARGETIVVAEAVVSRNLPDITDSVRDAVYRRIGGAPTRQAAAPMPIAPAMAPPLHPEQNAPMRQESADNDG